MKTQPWKLESRVDMRNLPCHQLGRFLWSKLQGRKLKFEFNNEVVVVLQMKMKHKLPETSTGTSFGRERPAV